MTLHMPTLVITFSLITYLCTAIFISNYFYINKKYKGLLGFVFSHILFSLAITLVLLSKYLADFISILTSNILMYLAMLTLLNALARFYDKKFSLKISLMLVVSFSLLFTYFTMIYANVNIRIIIFAIYAVHAYIHMTFMSYRADKAYDTKKFAYITFVSTLVYLIRIPIALLSDSITDYIFSSHIDTIAILLVLLNLLFITFGLLLLIQRRMDSDIRAADIKQSQLLCELQIQANTDNLTKLMNRRKIESELCRFMNMKDKFDQNYSLILIDIDYFKAVNDDYGHDAGDQVLIELSNMLKSNLKEDDLIARWGGEEFLIVMPDKTLDEAFDVAEKLRELTRTMEFPFFEKKRELTISSGVVELADENDIKTIISKVDKLLYKAKDNGRNITMAS